MLNDQLSVASYLSSSNTLRLAPTLDKFVSRVIHIQFYLKDFSLKSCIPMKLHNLCCLSIGQYVWCCGTAWYWLLIHMIIHKSCTSFVDTESGELEVLRPSSPFLLRDFMLMGVKDPLGHRVWASTQIFVPWSKQMRVLDKKSSLLVTVSHRSSPTSHLVMGLSLHLLSPSCNKR